MNDTITGTAPNPDRELNALAQHFGAIYGRAATHEYRSNSFTSHARPDLRFALLGAQRLGALWCTNQAFAVVLWLDTAHELRVSYGKDWAEHCALVVMPRAERFAQLVQAPRHGSGLWWAALSVQGTEVLRDARLAYGPHGDPALVPSVIDTASLWRAQLAQDQSRVGPAKSAAKSEIKSAARERSKDDSVTKSATQTESHSTNRRRQ